MAPLSNEHITFAFQACKNFEAPETLIFLRIPEKVPVPISDEKCTPVLKPVRGGGYAPREIVN